jgi:hypothetical protein
MEELVSFQQTDKIEHVLLDSPPSEFLRKILKRKTPISFWLNSQNKMHPLHEHEPVDQMNTRIGQTRNF